MSCNIVIDVFACLHVICNAQNARHMQCTKCSGPRWTAMLVTLQCEMATLYTKLDWKKKFHRASRCASAGVPVNYVVIYYATAKDSAEQSSGGRLETCSRSIINFTATGFVTLPSILGSNCCQPFAELSTVAHGCKISAKVRPLRRVRSFFSAGAVRDMS